MNFKDFIIRTDHINGRFGISVEKSWYNYIGFNIHYPEIFYGKFSSPDLLDDVQEFGIKARNEIIFLRCYGYKSVSILLLGFGISVNRQTTF